MSEREYVEHLLGRAEDYIAVVRRNEPAHHETIMNWEGAKTSLSAHLMRDLCKLWLASDDLHNAERK